MTMKLSFSKNSFVKLHWQKNTSHKMIVLYPNPCLENGGKMEENEMSNDNSVKTRLVHIISAEFTPYL